MDEKTFFQDELENAAREIREKIEQLLRKSSKPLLIAIDGRSGTGKSTLADEVAKQTGGSLITGDDFYSGGLLFCVL